MQDSRHPWLLLLVTSITVIAVYLNIGSLNVILPVLTNYFNASPFASGWILLSYMLVNSICILIFGKLADICGRRKLYLAGIVVFTAASLFLGCVEHVWLLIVLRVVQAVGGALILTNTTPYITDVFPEKHLGTALGINVLVGSGSLLLGPVVGGFFVYHLGWRWVFWFNVPLCILSFILGYALLKPSDGHAVEDRIDYVGNVSIFISLGGLLFSLTKAGTAGWTHSSVLIGFILFTVFFVIFLVWERQIAAPTVDLSLFRDPDFLFATSTVFLNSLARSSVVLLVAFFYQVVAKENTLTVSLRVLPITLGMLLASPLSGLLCRVYRTLQLVTFGLVLTSLGMLILNLNMNLDASYLMIVAGQFLVGFGTGFLMTPNTKSIMLTVPKETRGMANGIRSMLLNIGTVLSTALALMSVTISLPPYLKDAVYEGARAQLNRTDLTVITGGFRLAFLILFIITLLPFPGIIMLRRVGKDACSCEDQL